MASTVNRTGGGSPWKSSRANVGRFRRPPTGPIASRLPPGHHPAELGLDLCLIDLFGFVNNYLGENEKNLRRVFNAARQLGDDPLLRRSRHALRQAQRSERQPRSIGQHRGPLPPAAHEQEYRGLAILTTNEDENRRIRVVLRAEVIVDARTAVRVLRRVTLQLLHPARERPRGRPRSPARRHGVRVEGRRFVLRRRRGWETGRPGGMDLPRPTPGLRGDPRHGCLLPRRHGRVLRR